MYRTLIWVTLLPAFVLGNCTYFQNTDNVNRCDVNSNLITGVQILGCTSAPCGLHRGDYYVTFVKFTVPRKVISFRPTVHFTVGLFTIEYVLGPEIFGCNWVIAGGPCPLQPDREIVYKIRLYVDPASPTLFSPVLTFDLVDENDISFACWTWVANIQ